MKHIAYPSDLTYILAYYFDDFLGRGAFGSGTNNIWTSSSACEYLIGGIGGQMRIYSPSSAGTYTYCYHAALWMSAAANSEISWRVKLSSATDIAVQIGLFYSTSIYVCFLLDTSSSANIQFVCKSTSTTTVGSGVAISTGWHEYKINMSTGACVFTIDGVKFAPITTNITANLVSPQFGIKTLVSRRYVYADWVEAFCNRA